MSTRPWAASTSALAALERALSEATEAQAQLEAARDALEFDRRGWRRSRSTCSRCAPPPASTALAVPELAALSDKFVAQLAALDVARPG